MGRGKIEIKKIENRTNRQVTFSKRRNGIMKKAQELTVLCDAKVSLIMISCTNKLYQYLSPGADIKKMYDEYQKIMGVDLWATHYEKMQEHEQQLLEINGMLRREINRRMGGDLDDLSFRDLCGLEEEMDGALEVIRSQRQSNLQIVKMQVHKIKTQTGTTRKKVKNLEERHGNLLMDLEADSEAPHFGPWLTMNQGGYDNDAAMQMTAIAANIYALSRHTCHLNLAPEARV
ncbi:hypothetical protein Cgig2_019622 [Carnegiea gigantea]|uniref:Uncharacterized protein n=1 Tax=Carnegiea gigantea TaxID=171969 RepID=A0A9Q1QKP4_9CARY|nr:hypothetical protein Cgig2_019622 [Carnegiea gigantea]